MKKIIIFLLFIILFTGCSNKDDELMQVYNKVNAYFTSSKVDRSNLGSYYLDSKRKVVVIELVDNSIEKQDEFKKIINSKYIEFKQGGPYYTSSELDFYISKKEIHDDIKFNDYYSSDDRTVYLSGNVDEFYIVDLNKNKKTLKNYFSTNNQTFDDSIKKITNSLDLEVQLWDGGTSIYKSKNKDITMIVCNTINGNKDVYIGDYLMEYSENCNTTTLPNYKEKFGIGHTLDDGRLLLLSFDVPYRNSSLSLALTNNQINIHEFLNKLDLVDIYKDGGSMLYKYNKNKREFGYEDFYVMVCNSLDNIHDIYVAKKKESLDDKCMLKIDDLDGVSMTIKDGSLTNVGATVIIKDISDRENIYGTGYEIEKEENGIWVKLEPKHEMVFTSMGYQVDDSHTLEFNINWDYHYGKLESGKYRILKSTSEAMEGKVHYITAEFVIE